MALAVGLCHGVPQAGAETAQRRVPDQPRPKLPTVADLQDQDEADVLALTFPAQHRAKLHSANPIERLNGEIKRRTDVIGISQQARYRAVRRTAPS